MEEKSMVKILEKGAKCPPGFTVEDRCLSQEEICSRIIVLKQMRKTFVGIPSLARDIDRRGLLHPLILVELNPSQARKYVALVARAYGGNGTLRGRRKNNGGNYIFVVAGERRTKGIRKNNHDPKAMFPVRVFKPSSADADLKEMLFQQIAENVASKVLPIEDAEAIVAMWNLLPKENRTYKGLGESIGRSAKAVSDAVRVYGAPEYLKSWVNENPDLYGQGTEIARLTVDKVDAPEDMVKDLMARTFRKRTARKALSKKVSELITGWTEQRKGGPTFGLFSDDTDLSMALAAADDNEAKRFLEDNLGLIAMQLTGFIDRGGDVMPNRTATLLRHERIASRFLRFAHLLEAATDLLESGSLTPKDRKRIIRASQKAQKVFVK